MRENLRTMLRGMIEEDTGNKIDDLHDGLNLRQEIGLDSVDVVTLVSQVERRYRIRLSHEELQALVTVGDLLALLESKIDELPRSQAA